MAKGNMLLGKSRGSVGDVTFSQINGQQIAKARNRNPANPRTLKQCFQRARFAAAVKFYTRGTQALYKFAFESKRQVESDYNAFMRENVKRAPAISKAAFDNYDYPVIAPFIMSKGSLAPIAGSFSNNNFTFKPNSVAPAEVDGTLGQLSTALIASGEFFEGDIITVVYIASDYAGSVPSVDADGNGSCRWLIKQIILDSTSTESVSDLTGLAVSSVDDKLELSVNKTEDYLNGNYNAVTIIHSRNTASGLKVSTQELVLDTAAATAYEASQADAYKEAVAVSWKTAGAVDMEPEAILQGSIAYGQQ